ncbi:MAG: Fic family protein, partial [Planctomycetota bacterium]|nr:Fic family protein [Planctomycetota bacterium]
EGWHTYFVAGDLNAPAVWVHNRCLDPARGGFKQGIDADEIRALNRQLGGQVELTGAAESALANAARQEGFWNKAASLVRDIAGGHLFNDANKRTAQAVVNELARRNNVLSGVSQSQMRRVIDDVASGKLRDVREIARALRGS